MDVNSREPSQNIIPFRIKGVEIARFDSSGNLKIGTTTTLAPTVRLDISGGEARVNSGSVASTALTTTGRIGVNVASPTVSLDVSGAIQITASSVVATALTTRGRIGINTTSPPTSDLDVNGTVIMRSTLLLNNSLTLPTVFWHKSSDNIERLQYLTNGNTIFKSGSGFLWYDSNNAARMFLSNSGLLGIGTTLPTVALDVSGASRMDALSATSTALTTVGRIGVNKAAPTVDLDVSGEGNILTGLTIGSSSNSSVVPNSISSKLAIYHATDARIWLCGNNDGLIFGNNSSRSFIEHRPTSGEFLLGCFGNVPTKFKTANTVRMTILGDGKVGIGTETPTVALDVRGEVSITHNLNMNNTRVYNLNGPALATDAATKGYVDLGPTVTRDDVSSNVYSLALIRVDYISPFNQYTTRANLHASRGGSGGPTFNPSNQTLSLDNLSSGTANVSNYLSVGSGGSGSGVTTSILPNGFYVRTGGSNWRDYIPLLVADTTTNILIWGGPDLQWHDVNYGASNEIGKQYSYFAGYWLNANRAVVGTSFSVESYAGTGNNPPTSSRGTFTFRATEVSNGVVTAYEGRLSAYNGSFYGLSPQQDGINAGVARRSLSNRTLLMGGSVETGYLGVSGRAQLNASDATSTALTITGWVGIGTTTPLYPLDIVGFINTPTSVVGKWFGTSTPANTIASNNIVGAPISMRLNGSVWIESTTTWVGFWVASDRRIKKNINYNISSECLNLFRQLKCSNYRYIDERANKTNVYGYIAQDVSTVIPYAVTTQKGFIPSLYSLAKISKENGIVKITCSEDKTYSFHSLHDNQGKAFVNDNNEPASDNDGGRHFKLKLFDVSMNEYIVRINEILDNGVFTIENDDVSIKLTNEEYFVFGQEVDDYKILNNEAITIVATAALQEVDRQQQADKARIAELEATVASQQTLINDILERLNKSGL